MRDPGGEQRSRFSMDHYTWTCQCWPICKKLFADTRCSLEDLPGVMDDKDGWSERERGKSVLSARFGDDECK